MNGGVGVVAVGVVLDVPDRSRAAVDRRRGVAVPVAVRVRVERLLVGGIAVDVAVAVVVYAVADLHRTRVDRRVGVVAVVVGREAVAVRVDGLGGVAGLTGLDRVRIAGFRVGVRDGVGIGHGAVAGAGVGIAAVEVNGDGATKETTGRLRAIAGRHRTGIEDEGDEKGGNENEGTGHDNLQDQ